MPTKKKVNWSRVGKRSRAKGKAYQKEVARVISEHFGLPEEEVYSAMAGLTGADVGLSRAAKKLFPFAVESKDCKQINLASWLAEAEANADGVGLPFALIFKLHGRRRNYVVLDLDEFLQWLM